MRTVSVPYSGTFTPYTAGMTAWVPMIQAILAFLYSTESDQADYELARDQERARSGSAEGG
jgi:hypothetical protein